MIEIQNLDLSRLNNGAHFMFMSNVVSHAEKDSAIAGKVGNQFSKLREALRQEDEALKISQKSLLTDDISKADQVRDTLFLSYKKAVSGMLDMPIENMAEAAKVLNQHIKDYNIDVRSQLDKETGLLVNFLEDLRGKYSKEVQTLSLQGFVENLYHANEEVRQATNLRTDEKTGKTVGALKAARNTTDEAYLMFVKYINAYALIEGEQNYLSFINYMNTEIKHYKEEAMPRKKAKSDKGAAAQE